MLNSFCRAANFAAKHRLTALIICTSTVYLLDTGSKYAGCQPLLRKMIRNLLPRGFSLVAWLRRTMRCSFMWILMSPEDRELYDSQARMIAMRNRRTQATKQRLLELDFSDLDYNIALCGLTGDGKTSFVNAIRGKKPGMFEFIIPSAFKEGDKRVNSYLHVSAHGEEIKIWDMPGGGTDVHPLDTYFEEKCLSEFDSIFLFYTLRWTSIHDTIIRQAVQFHAIDRMVIVLNKTSTILEDMAHNHNKLLDDAMKMDFYASARSYIGEKVRELLSTLVTPQALEKIRIVFVCTRDWERNLHDEKQLVDMIGARAKMKRSMF